MKIFFKFLGVSILVLAGYYVWLIEFNYNFRVVTDNKVYKSGFINPNKLDSYIKENKINTIIDLMDPSVQDKLNPAFIDDIILEDNAVKEYNKKYNAKVKHISIPSPQVPTKKTLTKFFKILDDNTSYPVLIHCYHGTGRAQIYSALYRIEYENWKNEDARAKTRILVEGFGYRSSFADGKEKGDFLMNYKPRRSGTNSTLNMLKK